MKATISTIGVLEITAESELENYALSCWESSAQKYQSSMDLMTMENVSYRGSCIKVKYQEGESGEAK